jgi:cell division protein ZapA
MGQVLITLNGRTYRMACADGQEERLTQLGAHLKTRVDSLAIQFGQVGEERLLLMAGLLVTDELFEAREQSAAAEGAAAMKLTASTDAEPAAKPPAAQAERQDLAARVSTPRAVPGKQPGRN